MEYPTNIRQALEKYKQEKGSKQAFLFHQDQAFHFYNHEFCSIDCASVSLSCQQIQIEYQLPSSVIDSLFIRIEQDKILVATRQNTMNYIKNTDQKEYFRLALSYGILYDQERMKYLRGVVYVDSRLSSQIYVSYFTEPPIADLLELLMFQQFSTAVPDSCIKNPIIGDLARQIDQQNVKVLSKLYLKGKDINTFA